MKINVTHRSTGRWRQKEQLPTFFLACCRYTSRSLISLPTLVFIYCSLHQHLILLLLFLLPFLLLLRLLLILLPLFRQSSSHSSFWSVLCVCSFLFPFLFVRFLTNPLWIPPWRDECFLASCFAWQIHSLYRWVVQLVCFL